MSLNGFVHQSTPVSSHLPVEDGILTSTSNIVKAKHVLTMAVRKLSAWAFRPNPISLLPNETLLEILLHYSEFESEPTRHICLTSVCRLWRQIIISMRFLWTSISVHEPRREDIHFMRLWLNRAGSLPLSITVDNRDKNLEADTNEVLDVFFEYCDQWKSVTIILTETFQQALMKLPAAGPLKNLQHADFYIPHFADSDRDMIWAGAFASPNFSSVQLWIPFTNLSGAGIIWTKLKVIDCRCPISLKDAVFLLKSCPNIEAFDVTLDEDVQFYRHRGRDTVMPFLKKLCLNTFNYYCETIFNTITAPRLTDLDLIFVDSDDILLRSFKQFMERSKCNLNALTFKSSTVNPGEFLKWLDTPGMSTLEKTSVRIFNFEAEDINSDLCFTHFESLRARVVEHDVPSLRVSGLVVD